jgi:hypothetical protein
VSPLSCPTKAGLKLAKTGDLDVITLRQGFLDGLEKGVDDFCSPLPGQKDTIHLRKQKLLGPPLPALESNLFHHIPDDIRFCQCHGSADSC